MMTGLIKKHPSPFNLKRYRYAPRLERLEADALNHIKQWISKYGDPWISFSGGKDSLVALHLTMQVHPAPKIVFFDSGIEFPQTHRYITGICRTWGLEKHIYKATPDALDIMESTGTWERGQIASPPKISMHEALIERPMAQALQELGPCCIYGVRAQEAENRLMYLSRNNGEIVKYHTSGGKKGQVYRANLSPAWRWSVEEIFAYITKYDLPLNPLYRLQMEQGIPESRARVGLMVDGWAVEKGRWKVAYAIAPSEARLIEERLPILREWR